MDDSRQELKAIQDYLKRKAPRKLDERRIYYVYTHDNNRPARGELGCRWIGKGKGRRAWDIGRNSHWDAIFSKEFPPEVLFIAENLTEEEAFEIEKWMIANARAAGVKLCNMTDGGEGPSGFICSPETKKKRSDSIRLAFSKEETKRKHSTAEKIAADRRRNDPSAAKNFSDRIKDAVNTEEAKRKKSIALKTAWARRKKNKEEMEQYKIRLKHSLNKPETKEKMSKIMSDAWKNPEHSLKEKHAEFQKERWRKFRAGQ